MKAWTYLVKCNKCEKQTTKAHAKANKGQCRSCANPEKARTAERERAWHRESKAKAIALIPTKGGTS